MQITVADSTRVALVKARTLRCIYKTKYLEDVRWSDHAIAWAQTQAEELCQSVIQVVFRGRQDNEEVPGKDSQQTQENQRNRDQNGNQQPDSPGFQVQLIMVQLFGVSQRAMLCFDLFLDDCNPDLRRKIDQSTEQPIHLVNHQKDHGLMIGRAVPLDSTVADEYRFSRTRDKGPKPLYSDILNIPLYRNGLRVSDEDRTRLLRKPIIHTEPERRSASAVFATDKVDMASEKADAEQ